MPDETVKFVQLVKTYPILYNSTLPEYTQKEMTDRAWSEIAQQMAWLAIDCKEKWRSIRNAYVRSLKPYPSGTSAKAKRPYYLAEDMDFMLPYINSTNPVTHSENTANVILPETKEYQGGVELSGTLKRLQDFPIITEVKKLRPAFNETNEVNQTVLQGIQESKDKKIPTDSSKMFLLSLLPDLKSLSDKRVREFKILTMLLLEDLLTEQEKEVEDKCFRRPLPIQSSSSQVSTSAASSTQVSTTQHKGKEVVVGNTFIVPAKAESTTSDRQIKAQSQVQALKTQQQPIQGMPHQQPAQELSHVQTVQGHQQQQAEQGMPHQQHTQVLSQLQHTPSLWKGVLCYHNNSKRN